MRYSKVAYAVAFSAAVLSKAAATPTETTRANQGTGLTLDTDAVQSGSFVNGLTSIGAEAGQAASQTSQDNFINFCSGKTLTNGLQIVGGSCNGIVMGDIPAKSKMVSSIITFPKTGSVIPSDTTFSITVQMANLAAGSFTDADATYYAAPQFLQNGIVVGHTHVTVQDLGKDLNPTVALDATQFAFFKGINDAGNGQGLLTANVTGGLPAGNYRVCTMASASNHQPVLMPVAQRGTPDDCTKFVVSGDGTTINAAANNGAKGEAAASLASDAVVGATNSAFAASLIAAESSAAAAAAASASATVTSSSSSGDNNKKGNKKGSNAASSTSGVAGAATSVATGNGDGNKLANTGSDNSSSSIASDASSSSIASDASSTSTTSCLPVTATPSSKHHKQKFARRQFVA